MLRRVAVNDSLGVKEDGGIYKLEQQQPVFEYGGNIFRGTFQIKWKH